MSGEARPRGGGAGRGKPDGGRSSGSRGSGGTGGAMQRENGRQLLSLGAKPGYTGTLSEGGDPLSREQWDRVGYVLTSMIGKTVTVTDTEGLVYEGLFHECCANTKQGLEIVLQAVYNVSRGQPERGLQKPTKEIKVPVERFAQISVKQMELAKDHKLGDRAAFATDTEISGGAQRGGRELVAFQFDESVDLGFRPSPADVFMHICTGPSMSCGLPSVLQPRHSLHTSSCSEPEERVAQLVRTRGQWRGLGSV